MTTTDPTASPLSTPPTTSVVNNTPSAVLGKDDFLKLLVTQLKNQDPTSPTDSSQFMSQLAQFSALEQETNTSQSLAGLVTTSSVTQGVDLIGRDVGFTRSDGSTGSGLVDSVSVAGGSVVLDVGGEKVTPDTVTSVGQPGSTTTSQSTSATP